MESAQGATSKGDVSQSSREVRPRTSFSPSKVSFSPNSFNRFSGRPISDLLFVEVFAGTARLSITAREAGFRSLSVDKTCDRCTGAHIAIFDLTKRDDVESLKQIIFEERFNIVWIHFAPACGTCSRAREKQLPSLEAQGISVPKPLRSDDEPLGFHWLSGVDKVRVDAANLTYLHTCELIEWAYSFDIACSIENPANSIFWLIPFVLALFETIGGYETLFHNCCHGGLRRKLTKWWDTHGIFSELAAICDNDGSHEHLDWKPVTSDNKLNFPTSSEAAYPFLLCTRLIDSVKAHITESGALDPQNLQEQIEVEDKNSHSFILGMLPRGKKFRQLVSEFGQYIDCYITPGDDRMLDTFLSACPKGSRAANRRCLKWGDVRVDSIDKNFTDSKFLDANVSLDCRVEKISIGIPRCPIDFCNRSFLAGHPRSIAVHLSQQVQDALNANFFDEPHVVAKKRAVFFAKWSRRAAELRGRESEVLQSCPEHVKKIMKGKNLQLLREILVDLDYPDKTLVDDLCSGFKLTGWLPKSGVFPGRIKHPEYDVNTLKTLAKGLNKSILAQIKNTEVDEVAESTWATTLEEEKLGWIWRDQDQSLDNKVIAKRFGLQQKNKIRVIDDCSVCGLNAACGVKERFKIHAIDEMCAYVAWVFSKRSDNCDFRIVGKTFDLKSAYRQFCICKEDRDLARIMTFDTERRVPVIFGLNVLPFGAVGSVAGFLRVSLALHFIGVVGLQLAWTAFYDDYTIITSPQLKNSSELAASSLFDLLGVIFAKDGDKCVEFSDSFKTLGVMVDLSKSSQGRAYLGHTESRKEELQHMLSDVLTKGSIDAKLAESLRGRMQWFETFAQGRVANSAVKKLGDLAFTGKKRVQLNDRDRSALLFLRDRILNAPPLCIERSTLETWIVFVDGACEGSDELVGSIGGVLMSPTGRLIHHFSSVAPEYFMTACNYSLNPIYELELLPMLVSVLVWGHLWKGCQIVFYGDNDAARSSLIAGRSSTQVGEKIISAFVEREFSLQIKSWFSRVPTSSNIADGPSRLDCTEVTGLGSVLTDLEWNLISSELDMG